MKKTTKRLTMIVAILLTLVLLTSSIVSTTLAKYVVSKDAKTTVGLEAFGLTVDVKANYTGAGTAVESNKNGDSVTLTYANLNLKPGDNIANAIEVAVYGTAKVNVKVSINVTVAYGGDKFVVTKSNFSSLTTDSKTCVPIAFTVNSAAATTSYNELTESAAAQAIEEKISGYTYADGVASKTFNIDNDIVFLILITSLYKIYFVSSFVTFVKSNAKALLTSIRLSKDAVAPYGVVLGLCPAICELPPNRAVFVKPPCTP